MIKYQCLIKTDLTKILNSESVDSYLMLKATHSPSNLVDYTALDKWMYFYHTPLTEDITVWNIEKDGLYIDPGMQRFIGRALSGIEEINARLLTETPYVSDDIISIKSEPEVIQEQLHFPKSWKFANSTLTMMGEQRIIEDFWKDNLPEFFSKKSIKKHIINFKSRTFIINKNGAIEQHHQLDHRDEFIDLLKEIFSLYK